MIERAFKVKYLTLKNCFCYLSDRNCKSVDEGAVIKVSHKNGIHFFSVGSHVPSLKESDFGINSLYAKILKIEEDDFVLFSQYSNLGGIKSLSIHPMTNEDYQVMEIMAENVQSTLLEQVRIVNNDQKLVIWISDSIHITVDVEDIEPHSPGRLDFLTAVVIKPPLPEKRDEVVNKSKNWNISGFLASIIANKIIKPDDIANKYDKLKVPLVFRMLPVKEIENNIKNFNDKIVFNVYVHGNNLPLNIFKDVSEGRNLFILRPIQISTEQHNFVSENSVKRNIVVNLCLIDDSFQLNAQDRYFIPLFVNECIYKFYNLNIGAKVLLDVVNRIRDVDKIEISTNKIYVNEVVETFKLYLAENVKTGNFLLNSDFPLDIGNNCKVILNFTPSDVNACVVDSDFIRNCTYTITEGNIPPPEVGDPKNSTISDACLDYSNFKNILDGCMNCIKLGLTFENVLIVGKSGTGKTTLAQTFSENISSSSRHFYVVTINCKTVKGKSLESLHKLFTNKFLQLIYHQPSVLILDDLHVICEKIIEKDAPTPDSIIFNKIGELLAEMFQHYLHNNFITLLATTESTMILNQQIFSSRGKHTFRNIFTIDELNKNDRKLFLTNSFSKLGELEGIDVDYLATKTEGFVIQDLVDFVDKCVFEAYKEDQSKIQFYHCENALNNTSSLSLRNVELHSSGDRDFSDIGGLEDVKNILLECMLWPVQYTNIFGKAPLRLQSGLLLYGPPGTGKTIVAGAAAKQCGLRLISVKGPELLSKYIGASEQAVRNIFEKAQRAKPCILFFDEFDSLAPRRGHDNTGVTDRVVNQFLTQLDGVEALTGVCVLTATSRPDLLDPALLRPGRLDRQILCPLPDKESRLAILVALSKCLTFTSDVNLDEIAENTEGYSGADLQGVLYTAQLTSVEHLMDVHAETSDENIAEINQCHLEEAVKNTRPSLTRDEKMKYQKIYATFEGNGVTTDLMAGTQRSTLA